MANKSFKKMLQNNSPAMHALTMPKRILFIGALILYKIINPTIAKSIVAAVDMSVELTSNVLPNMTRAATARASVNAAGSAFNSTFVRKCPLIIFLFGSRARKNAGTPIVNILINDTCDGSNG